MQQSLTKSAIWLFFDRFLRMGAGFGVNIVLARTYGPESYGSLSFVVAIASVIGSLASLGFDELLPRELTSKDRGVSRSDAVKTALILRLWAEVISYLGLMGFVWYTNGVGQLFWIAAVYGAYFPLQATDVVEYARRADGEFKGIAILRTSASLSSAGFKLSIAWMGLPLLMIAWAMIAEYLIATVYYVINLLKNGVIRNGCWNSFYAKKLLHRSALLVISGALMILQARIDSLLIQHTLGTEKLGQYVAALKMVELFDALGIVLSILLIPEFGRRKGAELERWARLSYLVGGILYMAAIPFMMLLWHIFPWIYGQAYEEAKSAIIYLSPRPLFYLFGMIRMGLLISENLYGRIPLYGLMGMILNVFFYGALSELYGIEGAAMAGTLAMLVSGIILDATIYPTNIRRILQCHIALEDIINGIHKEKANQNKRGHSR